MVCSSVAVVDLEDEPASIADACRYSPFIVGGDDDPEPVLYRDRVPELGL